MTRSLFDSYLMVDWSASGIPKTGPDSIWIALVSPDCASARLENPKTRISAIARISDLLHEEVRHGRRVLAGFDFPFGYPAGAAGALTGVPGWEAIWRLLAEVIEEGPDNATNRFSVAASLNAVNPSVPGPFWGNGLKNDICHLPRKRPAGYGETLPSRSRAAEQHVASAQEVWKLAGAGSVGSQALTGIAALERMRHDPRFADKIEVWPFQTGLAEPHGPIVLAEVYPSLTTPDTREPIKDAGQVRAIAERFAALDRAGELAPLFRGSPKLTELEIAAIEREEAWILGAGFEREIEAANAAYPPTGGGGASGAVGSQPLRYERDPRAIYRQSFATVRAETRLDHLAADLHDVAIRLVHACGMTDLPNRLAWSGDMARATRAALAGGAPILCDCAMAAAGIVRTQLPADNRVICTLNDPATPERAAAIGNTRSAAAVELWRDHLDGSVVVIGNAPTALFHLLELLDEGWPRPAVILAFPVGFVGAAEAKAELAANPRGVPFLTLRGRRGGSALAAAALNGLAAGLEPPR